MRNAIYASLGANIRSRRESAGMSQEVLATKVGLSRTSITNIERGRQSVFVHQLFSFAEALGIGPATLLPSPLPDQQPIGAESVSTEVAEMVARLQTARSTK